MTQTTETETAPLLLPEGSVLINDVCDPLPYSVLLDCDIIGAGYSAEDAIAEAHATIAGWGKATACAHCGKPITPADGWEVCSEACAQAYEPTNP